MPVETRAPQLQTSNKSPESLLRMAQDRQRQGQLSIAASLYLQAAQGFAYNQDYQRAELAQNALHSTGADLTQTEYAADYYRLAATLALHNGRIEDASLALAQILPARDSNRDATLRVRSTLCATQRDWVCAAQALMKLGNPGDHPTIQIRPGALPNNAMPNNTMPNNTMPKTHAAFDSRRANTRKESMAAITAQQHHNQIWRYINRSNLAQAQQLAASARGLERGWWQLHLAAASGFGSSDQQQAITQWQRSNPVHPAQSPWPTVLANLLQPSQPLERIALLLPITGPLAAAGEAVRNGFVSAYLFDESNVQVRVFDSNAGPIENTFDRIRQWQAQVVLGPLAKGNLERINALNPTMPVLGLNYLATTQDPAASTSDANSVNLANLANADAAVDTDTVADANNTGMETGATAQQPGSAGQRTTADQLFQLGLAVEDEAETLVERLLVDGFERVLVLHSEQPWAIRAATAFSRSWPHTLTVEPFENVKTVTEAVGRGMFVDTSQLRSQQLYRLIGSHIEFEPRARKDLDAIVAIMDNTEAKALVPALKFHFANKLPVYASSQTVSGANQSDKQPLAGFQVSELPWHMLSEPLSTTVRTSFSLGGSSLSSLYALGADAYRMAGRLPNLVGATDLAMQGNTGFLRLDSDRRFHRQQLWGVISQGKLVAMPFVVGNGQGQGQR